MIFTMLPAGTVANPWTSAKTLMYGGRRFSSHPKRIKPVNGILPFPLALFAGTVFVLYLTARM
jgi:hypothetical protein